ncbi:hypothetical protein ACFYO1_15290 [Nocardia sp. NPDC006044]|uniref:hypothetical protein n=1 Tax=Nocardia sp. NPDC006044 TaxID=3364306 RepID=UPI003690760E
MRSRLLVIVSSRAMIVVVSSRTMIVVVSSRTMIVVVSSRTMIVVVPSRTMIVIAPLRTVTVIAALPKRMGGMHEHPSTCRLEPSRLRVPIIATELTKTPPRTDPAQHQTYCPKCWPRMTG